MDKPNWTNNYIVFIV